MQDYMDCIIKNHDNLDALDELEVILVNDSPWKTLEIPDDSSVSSYIKVITNDANMGIHASRVAGLKATEADYIMFLDQDDLLADNAIAEHVAFIKTKLRGNAEHFVSVSNALLEQKDMSKLLWYRTDYHKNCVGDLKTYIEVGTQIISPGQCLIKRDLIPDFWLNNIMSVNGADDYFLWILMLSKGVPFEVNDKPLYIHRNTGNNISAETKKTDESTYEFLTILGEADEVPSEYVAGIMEMVSFKAAFREAGKIGKCAVGLSNLRLLIANIRYKSKTKTKLGFNR